jgi:AMMECR1 domain-containing protein
MMADYVLGMNGKLYQGTVDNFVHTSANLVNNVRDVTLSLEAGEADVTTRGNDGWRATAATLREASVEFSMIWKPTDPRFAAIRNAFLSSNQVSMSVLDGLVGTGEGLVGNFTVTNFSRGEPLEEAMTVDVTAKLSKFESWKS